MDAARLLLFTALFIFAQAGLLRVWLILTVGIVSGACSVFFQTALVVAVRDLFPLSALLGANSAIELANQVSFVLGPAAAGLLAATAGLHLALLIDALTFLVSLLSLACVRSRSPRARDRPPPPGLAALRHEIREGFRYLISVRLLVTLTVMQMAVNLCLSVEKFIFYYAKDTLRLSSLPVSIIVAAGGAGGILGALTAAPLARRVGQIRLIAAAIGACGIAVAAMSAATSFASLLLANLAYLWALVVAGLLNRTQRQQSIPRELLGRVTGTVRLLFLTVEPLGVLIAGTLTAALGNDPRLVFLGSGTLVTITAVTGWFLGLRTRTRSSAAGVTEGT
jgi:predicted MFS family arabinose efflux permease